MSVLLPMPLLGFVTASVLTGSVALTHFESKHGDLVDEGGITQEGNVPYDGRFTFARIRFGMGLNTGSFGRSRGRGGLPPWAHDHPRAERNFMNILRETTLLQPYMDGGNIFTTDDRELTRFPMAYISEPGYWNPTESEVEGLRSYLLKGGFLIADDFRSDDWFNFDTQMK